MAKNTKALTEDQIKVIASIASRNTNAIKQFSDEDHLTPAWRKRIAVNALDADEIEEIKSPRLEHALDAIFEWESDTDVYNNLIIVTAYLEKAIKA